MTFAGNDLLPSSATPLERAIADLEWDRLGGLDVSFIADLIDPETCPLALLPWLAWSVSVDVWDEAWSEERKRMVIGSSLAIHRMKGTRSAVRQAIEALSLTPEIAEWWEATPTARRGTFNIVLDLTAEGSALMTEALLTQVIRSVRATKRKSAVATLQFGGTVEGDAYGGGPTQNVLRTTIQAGRWDLTTISGDPITTIAGDTIMLTETHP